MFANFRNKTILKKIQEIKELCLDQASSYVILSPSLICSTFESGPAFSLMFFLALPS